MRELDIGTKEHTVVVAKDLPSHGSANHHYCVYNRVEYNSGFEHGILASIHFQNGPIGEYGINGIHNEDLLAIVIDRLEGFQSGDYQCRENGMALHHLEAALNSLRKRTDRRKEAGIEGTSKHDVCEHAQEQVTKQTEGGVIPMGEMPDYAKAGPETTPPLENWCCVCGETGKAISGTQSKRTIRLRGGHNAELSIKGISALICDDCSNLMLSLLLETKVLYPDNMKLEIDRIRASQGYGCGASAAKTIIPVPTETKLNRRNGE